MAIHFIGNQDGAPYIVSELLEGESLLTRIDGIESRAFLAGFVFFLLGSASVGWRGIIFAKLAKCFCNQRRQRAELLIALGDPLIRGFKPVVSIQILKYLCIY